MLYKSDILVYLIIMISTLTLQTYLEASGAPVHKLNGPLGFDLGNGCVHILGHHVSTVEHTAGHVLAVSGVALDHLVGGLETGVGDFHHGQLLMVGL